MFETLEKILEEINRKIIIMGTLYLLFEYLHGHITLKCSFLERNGFGSLVWGHVV